MLYIKYFIIYSILGFIHESFLFKFRNIHKHSGALNGPYTLVYGFGGAICAYINNYFNNIFLLYLSFMIICTTIEFLIGHLIHLIYHIDSWNYSYKKYHFGKYITLDYALIWGLMALIFVKYANFFFYQLTLIITDQWAINIIIIMLIDSIYTYWKYH